MGPLTSVADTPSALPACNIVLAEDKDIPVSEVNDETAALAWALLTAIKQDPEVLKKALEKLRMLEIEGPEELKEMIPQARQLLESNSHEIQTLWYNWVIVEDTPTAITSWEKWSGFSLNALVTCAKVVYTTVKFAWKVGKIVQGPCLLLLKILLNVVT